MEEFKGLGKKVGLPEKPSIDTLEWFGKPPGVKMVTFKTEEYTSLCPVTGQPDFCTVTITYWPIEKCVESKSLKLYLQSYRNEKGFMEAISNRIAHALGSFLECQTEVIIRSNPRGGLALEVVAIWNLH